MRNCEPLPHEAVEPAPESRSSRSSPSALAISRSRALSLSLSRSEAGGRGVRESGVRLSETIVGRQRSAGLHRRSFVRLSVDRGAGRFFAPVSRIVCWLKNPRSRRLFIDDPVPPTTHALQSDAQRRLGLFLRPAGCYPPRSGPFSAASSHVESGDD